MEGRKTSSFIGCKEILENCSTFTIDQRVGFYRYEYGGWEMVYNPTTKEILHIQPIKNRTEIYENISNTTTRNRIWRKNQLT